MEIVNNIVMLPISDIKPYHKNVRRNDLTIEKLVQLIPKVGFNVPLVLDKNNVIVKGHTRWTAAIRLGIQSVPVVYTNADEETIKLDRIADNKVQEFSLWDTEALLSEVSSFNVDFDLSILDLKFELPSLPVPEFAPGEHPVHNVERDNTPNNDAGGFTETPQNGEEFITESDVEKTVARNVNDYLEVVCDKCGNRMFILK